MLHPGVSLIHSWQITQWQAASRLSGKMFTPQRLHQCLWKWPQRIRPPHFRGAWFLWFSCLPLIIFKVDRWKPHWCWGLHFVLFVCVLMPVSADSSPSSYCVQALQTISRVNCWCLGEPVSPRTAVNRAALGLKTASSCTHGSWEEKREPTGTGRLFMFVKNLPRASVLLALSI